MQAEEELVEAALMRYAQRAASRWGAERFRRELERRDLEERWIEASRTNSTPYTPVEESTGPTVPVGPVDVWAQEAAVGPVAPELTFERHAYARHPSVPRPPSEEPSTAPRRRRLRSAAAEPARDDPARFISPAEAARMSAASRRLYGLDPVEPRG
jgi:hypothetical protein